MTEVAVSGGVTRTFHFLNVIRFASALWVVLSHVGAPPLDSLCGVLGLEEHATLVRKALIAPFSGVAAVMVFFAVSGFCIHHPYVMGKVFGLRSFYTQRFTRIGLPLLAAVVLHAACGTTSWFKNVVWSIYCEAVYYAAYPLLRVVMSKVGTGRVLAAAYLGSWLFCLQPDTGYGHIIAYGHGWTWLVYLPAWLCGCLLAEWMGGTRPVPGWLTRFASCFSGNRAIIAMRAAVWALSSVLLVLGMEEIVVFKYSLPVFALVVLVWLLTELRRPCAETWMARAGVAGYSLFLIHPVGEGIDATMLPGLHPMLLWGVRMLVALAASAVFYQVIERPSHQLARALGRRWK
jgi:peptidoglycan/LPS O-acetylase OafA/YrhL